MAGWVCRMPADLKHEMPGQHPVAGGPERNAGVDLSEVSRSSATRRQEAGMALSASSMVIASPPRSRCLARRTGVSDIRDIGQPVLAEVDSRTSRAETSSVTDETGSRATPTK
jgi:hypothetical protein